MSDQNEKEILFEQIAFFKKHDNTSTYHVTEPLLFYLVNSDVEGVVVVHGNTIIYVSHYWAVVIFIW